MTSTSISVNLTGVSGNVYAAAGYNTIYTNVPQANAINFLVGTGASIQITNPNYTTDPVTGYHALETIQVQSSYTNFTAWSYYGQVVLTNTSNGQTIQFQLTEPTGNGGGNNSGVNVQFLDGSLAFTSNVSNNGAWTVWITQGSATTANWGTNSVSIPYTDTTAVHLTTLGASGTHTVNTAVNSSAVTNWTGTPPVPPATTWSSSSGLGEISALYALDLATGQTLPDVTPSIPLEWGISSVKFQDAWAAGYTGKGVVIADIDTGVDLSNSALTHNLSQNNWNFVSNSANVQDDNGHGSFTASELIATAGSTNNGVVGGAYGAQLMVLKALDASGSGSDNDIANAIIYAVDHGANVINMSLGGSTPNTVLQSAVQYAANHNVVMAIAAGNSGGSSPEYPAAYAQTVSNTFSVGAAQQSGSSLIFASFSNHAGSTTAYNFVDAPGVSLQGYNARGQVVTQSGTSMAAPLVAAEAAVLEQAIRAIHSNYTVAQVAAQVVTDITQSTTALSLVGVASQSLTWL